MSSTTPNTDEPPTTTGAAREAAVEPEAGAKEEPTKINADL